MVFFVHPGNMAWVDLWSQIDKSQQTWGWWNAFGRWYSYWVCQELVQLKVGVFFTESKIGISCGSGWVNGKAEKNWPLIAETIHHQWLLMWLPGCFSYWDHFLTAPSTSQGDEKCRSGCLAPSSELDHFCIVMMHLWHSSKSQGCRQLTN